MKIYRLCLISCSLLIASVAMAQHAGKKNVLFIVVDDLKPVLGCYGDNAARTPNIDRLAARSRVFDRAYCQEAVCAPSRTSFMTGKRPDQLKIWTLSQPFRPLHPTIITLPQHFKNNGYTTAAAGKIYHDPLAHHDPASWSWPALLGVTGNGPGTKYVLAENAGKSKAAATERVVVDDSGYIDGKVAAAAIDLLSRLKEQPFFLAVGFRRPHLPFTAPDQYWKYFDNKQLPYPDTTIPEKAPSIAFHRSEELRGYTDIPDKGGMPSAKVKELLQGYYAAVSYTDAQIGKLLHALDQYGLTDNTIVVLLSDHGFHLGEQGMWGKSTNFETATRVPLMISAPGVVERAGHAAALVELVDLYPTLTELCGLPPVDSLAGTSLLPVLRDPVKQVKDYAISQFIRPYAALGNESRITTMGYSLRTAKYRFTEWYDFTTKATVATELYALDSKDHKSVNLSDQPAYADQVKQLRQRLQKAITNSTR